MKKMISILTALTIAGANVGCSLASTAKTDNAIKVIYDGTEMTFDVDPTIINDSTMVPMRAIFEQFGAKVKWDGETRTVTAKKKSKTITMTIDSNTAAKNDEEITLETAPQIVDDRTLVPVRAISEMLGLDVEWDEETRTVIISTPEDKDDDSWKNNTGAIDLSSMTVSGSGVSVSDNVITISEGGDFTVTGTLSDGMILVNTKDKVKLRLSGASITNSSGAAIYFEDVDKGYITLTENTQNYLTSAASEDTKGAITAKDNLEIKGKGSLTITAGGQGIHASDSLEIENGNITITSEADGINVNDTLAVSGGVLNITSKEDGMQADEIVDITGGTVNITTTGEVASSGGQDFFRRRTTENTASDTGSDTSSKGIKADWTLDISGGDINLNTTDHAIHSSSDININGGDIEIASSAGKGISGHEDVTINGGEINITNSTEGIESKQILTINDGTIRITASDDGLNAGGGDTMGGGMRPMGGDVTINGESMTDQNKTDGMNRGGRGRMNQDNTENSTDLSNGEIPQMGGRGRVGMSRDMNGAMPQMGGRGGMPQDMNGEMPQMDGNMPQMGGRGGMPQDMNGEMPQMDGNMPQMGGRDGMPQDMNGEMPQVGGGFGRASSQEVSSEHHIQINGGYIYIDAKGDGIDSNASIIIDGGTVIVNGPTNNGNSALDHDGLFQINGGTVIAAGSSGMIENPSDTSAQNVLSIYLSSAQEAGTPVSVLDESGNTIVCFTPKKQYAHLHFSSDKLETGKTYSVYVGGEYSGSFTADGVGEGGSISGGTADGVGTIESALTIIGTASSGMGMNGGMGGRGGFGRNTGTEEQ